MLKFEKNVLIMELTNEQILAILILGSHFLGRSDNREEFEEAAGIVSQMDEDAYDWAIDFLYKGLTANGPMTPAQEDLWNELMEIYWLYQEPDDKGTFDAYA